MKSRPASGVLLARALIESALFYRIKYKKMDDKLKNTYKKDINYINLQELLTFSINNVNTLFQDHSKSLEVLKKIQSEHRPYMNSIVHGDWIDQTTEEIKRIAGTTRELLRTILTDSP